MLLNHGTSVTVRTRAGESILHIAVDFGTIKSVRILLRERKFDINKRDYNGNTAFRLALIGNHYRKIKMLLDARAAIYPPGELKRLVYPDHLPWLTIPNIIPNLAQEVMEERTVNPEDILTLEKSYPELYDYYMQAFQEWRRMRETYITREISYADLVEKSTTSLLFIIPRH